VLKGEENSPFQTSSLPRANRLYGRDAMLRVISGGRKLNRKGLKLSYIEGESNRFAVSVVKRYGKAVERNRIKRIIREFLRQNKSIWPKNRWILIKVFKKCDTSSRAENESQIIGEIEKLLKRVE